MSTENAHAASRVLESYQSDAATKINYIDFLAAAMCKWVPHRTIRQSSHNHCYDSYVHIDEKCFHPFTVCLRLHHFILFVLSALQRMADQFTSHLFSPTDIHLNLLNSFTPLLSIRRIAIDEERLVLAFETLDVESKGKQSNKQGEDTHTHLFNGWNCRNWLAGTLHTYLLTHAHTRTQRNQLFA